MTYLMTSWFVKITFSFALCGSQECACSTAHTLSCEKIVFETTTRSGVSNSNCSVGHMRTYKVTRRPHYDADATIVAPKLNFTSYLL